MLRSAKPSILNIKSLDKKQTNRRKPKVLSDETMNEEFTAGQKQQKCKKIKYDAISVLTFLGEGEEIRQVTNIPR